MTTTITPPTTLHRRGATTPSALPSTPPSTLPSTLPSTPPTVPDGRGVGPRPPDRDRRPGDDVGDGHRPRPLGRWGGGTTGNDHRSRPALGRANRWVLTDPGYALAAVWIDHLADGYSTTRLRGAARSRRPV